MSTIFVTSAVIIRRSVPAPKRSMPKLASGYSHTQNRQQKNERKKQEATATLFSGQQHNMDCVIPAHNIRIFNSAVSSLCKIGKELLIEFSPQEGLTLRSLNDAKSAFSSFKFEVGFFERCSSPVAASATNNKTNRSRHTRIFGEDNDNNGEEKYMARVLLKTIAAVLRSRRGVQSLRLRSSNSHSTHSNDTDTSSSGNFIHGQRNAMLLVLEFKCEPGGMRISHRIGVAELESSVTAVAPRDECSKIIATPKTLIKMVDPLKRTAEVAMTVNDDLKTVKMSSFHHSDAASSSCDTTLLGASAVLKTETSMNCEDFDDFIWRSDREVDDEDEGIPSRVNDEVVLVFGIKEVKVRVFCVIRLVRLSRNSSTEAEHNNLICTSFFFV